MVPEMNHAAIRKSRMRCEATR